MRKGGAEREVGRMAKAIEALREVVEVVDEGKAGATVLMPLEQATLVFRIPEASLQKMRERKQELGISVVDEKVEVKLYGGETQRREAYDFLYGLTQHSLLGTAPEFLAIQEIPPSLKEEFPRIEGIIGGGVLTDVDLTLLRLHLEALWRGLRDKEGLYPPEQALPSVAY
jgi:hypothetical protein